MFWEKKGRSYALPNPIVLKVRIHLNKITHTHRIDKTDQTVETCLGKLKIFYILLHLVCFHYLWCSACLMKWFCDDFERVSLISLIMTDVGVQAAGAFFVLTSLEEGKKEKKRKNLGWGNCLWNVRNVKIIFWKHDWFNHSWNLHNWFNYSIIRTYHDWQS